MYYKGIIRDVLEQEREFIPEFEAYKICEDFNIPHPPYKMVSNKKEALAAAEAIGYPVVLKIVSPRVIHKSDVGGVIVGIDSPKKLEVSFDTLLASVKSKVGEVPLDGVLVQKSMPTGIEVVVGGLRDKQFGPVVMFGSGGILIEVFKDVSFRLAPLDREEAERQIAETRTYQILKGVRGKQACNLELLADLIVNTGKLLVEVPEVEQIDFNPVFAYPENCCVVDARIMVKSRT